MGWESRWLSNLGIQGLWWNTRLPGIFQMVTYIKKKKDTVLIARGTSQGMSTAMVPIGGPHLAALPGCPLRTSISSFPWPHHGMVLWEAHWKDPPGQKDRFEPTSSVMKFCPFCLRKNSVKVQSTVGTQKKEKYSKWEIWEVAFKDTIYVIFLFH